MSADSAAASFVHLEPLTHGLAPQYAALRAIRTRKALHATPLWAEIRDELARVLDGVERGDHAAARPRPIAGLRAVAWNIRRGADFDGVLATLRDHPALASADLYLLSECDDGMGRSGNRNVARDLAAALGTSYAFGVSYLALEDDIGENAEGRESTLALAGAAVLSRLPLRRVENVDLPELRDKFSSSEKRLGKKRALLVEVETTDGPLAALACHLDSNASPRQRAEQLAVGLDRLEATGCPRLLVGGDLNSSTYDASGALALFRDLGHKFLFTGFRGTVDNYMTPERRYETPMFELLATRGYVVDGFNDRSRGTLNYDLQDPFAIRKVERKVGRFLRWYLQRRLRPWNGVCAARLDWFAGRGVAGRAPGVVDARHEDGRPISDHGAIHVELCPV